MRKTLLLMSVLAAICFAALPASAVPLYPNVPNTFDGAAEADDAGHLGAAAGTQAALWAFPGSEVSIIPPAGAVPAGVNLPQAAQVFGPPPLPAFPSPAAAVFQTTQVKDGTAISFGLEMTGVLGGLWPVALNAVGPIGIGTLDNGLASGSTAADGNLDQLTQKAGGSKVVYDVLFGPHAASPYPYGPILPVFEIYEDVPSPSLGTAVTDLSPGVIKEEMLDFDGTPPGASLIGPSLPPVAVPSQFENVVDGFPAKNGVGNAVDGSLFAAGFIDLATAEYTFFDPNVIDSGGLGQGLLANGGYVYSLTITAKGRVTAGSVLPLLLPISVGTAYDGGDINITFVGTLYGVAYPTVPGAAGNGIDPSQALDIRTSLAGNSGDMSFTIVPMPEPATIALLGLSLVPLVFRRKKCA